MSRGNIADIETARRKTENITLAKAIALCDALHVSNPRKLLDPEGTEQKRKDC